MLFTQNKKCNISKVFHQSPPSRFRLTYFRSKTISTSLAFFSRKAQRNARFLLSYAPRSSFVQRGEAFAKPFNPHRADRRFILLFTVENRPMFCFVNRCVKRLSPVGIPTSPFRRRLLWIHEQNKQPFCFIRKLYQKAPHGKRIVICAISSHKNIPRPKGGGMDFKKTLSLSLTGARDSGPGCPPRLSVMPALWPDGKAPFQSPPMASRCSAA